MAEESLLTPALQAQIGVRSEPVEVLLDAATVARTVQTYGGARREVRAGDEAPAAVLIALASHVPHLHLEAELREFAQVSHELAVVRPLLVGERLVATTGVQHIMERLGGRFGHHIQVRCETELIGDDGRVAGRVAWTDARFDRRPRPSDFAPAAPADAPAPAGAAAKPGSDGVEAGDELPPLHTRFRLIDNVRSCALNWNFSPYFFDTAYRANAGSRRIPVPGPLRLLHLFRAAESWRGESGYVRSVRIAYRTPLMVGTPFTVRGLVTQVTESDGVRFADVEMEAVHSTGTTFDRGFATVELR